MQNKDKKEQGVFAFDSDQSLSDDEINETLKHHMIFGIAPDRTS